MLIAATSDLDALTGDFAKFADALAAAKKPDLFLWAGDMCDFRMPHQYRDVLRLVERAGWDCPIVAVWGNKEFEQDYEKIKQIVGKRVVFLDDEMFMIEVGGRRVGIVGTKGCLDRPTWWQSRSIPDIKERYANRFEKVVGLLKNMKTLKCNINILLSHYALTYQTLKGERPEIYGGLGYKAFEKAIAQANLTFAVHGHAHFGIPLAFVDSVPVFNVAMPVNKGIVLIDPDKLPVKGLRGFV
ncbi:MAG: metallophosphoesterase [Candidatus Aenigmatarchaeota archaeon]|nr:metallophosphoesterase [Candidatus Aenigmarchaeota archaeon]